MSDLCLSDIRVSGKIYLGRYVFYSFDLVRKSFFLGTAYRLTNVGSKCRTQYSVGYLLIPLLNSAVPSLNDCT